MSDSATSTDNIIVIVPPELREKYPDLIELVLHSESMNNTERQYWIDLLPMMEADKVEQLRTILTNERDQLAEIDAKYAEDSTVKNTFDLEKTQAERTEKRESLSAKENAERTEAEQNAEDILKQID